jgi:hypothetical protein
MIGSLEVRSDIVFPFFERITFICRKKQNKKNTYLELLLAEGDLWKQLHIRYRQWLTSCLVQDTIIERERERERRGEARLARVEKILHMFLLVLLLS